MKQTRSELEAQLEGMKTLETHLTFQLARLAKLLEQHGALLLAPEEINLTGYRMMMIIDIFEQITVSDLSRVMLIDAGLISRTAKDMVEQGLIEYHPVPNNQRKKYLSLTQAGHAAFARFKAHFDTREEQLSALLPVDHTGAFWTALNALSGKLEDDLRNGF